MTQQTGKTEFISIDMDTYQSLKAADSVIIPDDIKVAFEREMARIENEMTRLERS